MSKNNVHTSERVILDVGRQKRKSIRKLKKGLGPVAEEVRETVQAVAGEHATADKEVVPVVIVYRKRDRKRRGLLGGILRRL